MDEYHRCDRTDHGVEGSGFQPGTTGILLRSRHRDSDTTLDGLRCKVLWRAIATGGADDNTGARLYLTDLVYTLIDVNLIYECPFSHPLKRTKYE
jgi:hypothetical protein